MQRTPEQQAIALIISKLKSFKGKLTAGDAATLTGLAIHEAKDALDVLMNRYICKLQVTESGEILYSFGDRLQLRGEKSLNDYLEQLGDVLWRAFKALFKVWITVMLVVYFIIFVLIVIAALVASFAGSKDGKKIRLGWIVDLFADLTRLTARTGMLVYATDAHGYQHKTYAQTKRNNSQALEPKKRLVQSVYDYVFGPARPEFDPLANAKEAAAYLRSKSGLLTTAEVVALAGYTFSEADEQFTDYLTRFKGRPEITEDGVVIGKFDQLLQTAEKDMEGAPVEYFWNEYEAPFVLTGNTKGRNTFITFVNAFNLVLSFIFLTGDFESVSLGQSAISGSTITIVLGWIPFLFSAIFFMVPLLRFSKIRTLEKERLNRNMKRRFIRVIYDTMGYEFTLDDMIAAVNRGPEEKLTTQQVQQCLNGLLIDLQGTGNVDENGAVKYLFPRINREYQTVKKLRDTTMNDQNNLGKVIAEN